jgi:peptidoglycan/xylan/chitin deacetylase (PgdA/CDA1 family)
MSGAEIQRLASRPGHRIGAHTVNHLFLPTQPPNVVRQELSVCKQQLEHLLQKPVSALAYPYGAASDDVVRQAAAAGFTTGVTVRREPVTAGVDALRVPRIEVDAGTDLRTLLARCLALP